MTPSSTSRATQRRLSIGSAASVSHRRHSHNRSPRPQQPLLIQKHHAALSGLLTDPPSHRGRSHPPAPPTRSSSVQSMWGLHLDVRHVATAEHHRAHRSTRSSTRSTTSMLARPGQERLYNAGEARSTGAATLAAVGGQDHRPCPSPGPAIGAATVLVCLFLAFMPLPSLTRAHLHGRIRAPHRTAPSRQDRRATGPSPHLRRHHLHRHRHAQLGAAFQAPGRPVGLDWWWALHLSRCWSTPPGPSSSSPSGWWSRFRRCRPARA